MATIEITKDNFASGLLEEGIVLLDFWANWCGPCRAFAPIFEAAAVKHADITFGKIDTEDQVELAQQLGIRALPTLAVLRDGILLLKQPGLLPPAALEALIGKVRELDMDQVRRDINAQAAPAPDRAASSQN